MSTKRLITSALPYVNNVPHLGNIIGSTLSADVYARYCRARGYETLYICATDEYGTATENKAREEGLSPREICDKYHQIHAEVYKTFNIQFDYFGRTSCPEHVEVTQSIFLDLDRRGMLIEQEQEQTYCEHDQMFLADRYVEGICPHCKTPGARGDQCEACGKLLQPTELLEPKCQVCGNAPTTQKTQHLYIDLPKLEGPLTEWHQASNQAGHWSANAETTTQGWIDRGLQPRPITRDLKWGVPVPKEGYENKVFYVWFDAPIGYISATKAGFPESWESWWFDPKGTRLYQFMAKDNIPFHTVVFPASLIGTGRDWTLLHHINSTEYLNYEGGKFSKSRSIGIFGSDVIHLEKHIPIDLWRFYLLYIRPESADANFVWESFIEDVNSNFIDNIGNLLNRVLVFYHKNFEGPLVAAPGQQPFLAEVKRLGGEVMGQLEEVKLREALRTILAMGRLGNKHFHEQEPWKLIKEDPAAAKELLVALCFLLHDIGQLLSPYMPETSGRILAFFGQKGVNMKDHVGHWTHLEAVTPALPELLFKKLDPKEILKLKESYSGKRHLEEEEAEPAVDPMQAWAKIEIKVGKILSCEPHPEADRLYVEQIDLGEGSPRTIVSGLVKYYAAEELVGRKVLVASNLAAANLRGVQSQGMVLAVEKKKKLEVVDLAEAEIGQLVYLEGEEPKAKTEEISIDDFFAAPLTVKEHRFELNGRALMLAGKEIHSAQIANGKVG
ncbi:MAG: methionine--tRNA ligase [bacterium]|nr:methionine--tRNA ligase [bacterium]